MAKDFGAAPSATRPPDFRFSFTLKSGPLRVVASSTDDSLDMPVDWAFGAGSQGVTFVSRGNEAWYLEHAMSYFPAAGAYDRTPGHDRKAKTLTEAVGILYPVHDPRNGIVACFECHSTGPVLETASGILPTEQGVQCESCHGPGGDHVTAVTLGEVAAARASIVNPVRLQPEELSRMCGRCHRPPGAADSSDFDPSDVWNVRHAPPYLQRSACFSESEGALSCLSCHQAHEPLQRAETAAYAARCRQCHNSIEHATAIDRQACVDCHMPKVKPHPRLAFTNHRIGVYAPEEPLKPLDVRASPARRK